MATVTRAAARMAVVGLSTLLIGLLTGCVPEVDCEAILQESQVASESDAADVEVVLLVDRTDSTKAGNGAAGTAPSFATALVEPLRTAVDDGAVVSVGGFDGSAASVTWTRPRTATRSTSQNEQRAEYDRQQSVECLTGELERAAGEEPQGEGTDVLGALAAAAERLEHSPAQRRVIAVATDGLTNVGCANLNQRAPGDQEDLLATVQACQDSGEIPDLTGVDVRILGVGHPGPDHEQPSSPQLQALRRFWTGMCEATGASCAVTTILEDPGDDATEPPRASGVDDPTVALPDVEVLPGPDGPAVVVPASLLFETDSAALTSDAQLTIGQVVDEIRRQSATQVRVEGHADARADEDYNRELSTRRAEAVRDVLLQAGVTNVTAEGLGESRPRQDCGKQFHPDGTPDPRAMACNRRVEIHLALPRG